MKAELLMVIVATFYSLCISSPTGKCIPSGECKNNCIHVKEINDILDSEENVFKNVFIPTPTEDSGDDCAHEYLNGLMKLTGTESSLNKITVLFKSVAQCLACGRRDQTSCVTEERKDFISHFKHFIKIMKYKCNITEHSD